MAAYSKPQKQSLPLRSISSTSIFRQKDSEPPSFKGQLYESTQQRLKRERAEQERFSGHQTQSPGGRYAAVTFGMFH
jgi:D-lactate dehydrogenase (cytochrome)